MAVCCVCVCALKRANVENPLNTNAQNWKNLAPICKNSFISCQKSIFEKWKCHLNFKEWHANPASPHKWTAIETTKYALAEHVFFHQAQILYDEEEFFLLEMWMDMKNKTKTKQKKKRSTAHSSSVLTDFTANATHDITHSFPFFRNYS